MTARNSADFAELKKILEKRHNRIKKHFHTKHKDSLDWLENSSKHIALGSLSGLLLLSGSTSPQLPTTITPTTNSNEEVVKNAIDKKDQFLAEIKEKLPNSVKVFSENEEKRVVETLIKYFNLPIKAEIEGKRLNRNYGLIGAEQHLMRYPGDTMTSHFQTPEEGRFTSSGMAPGRGAWGYFVPAGSEMTQKDIDREKYYIAVQTFLSKGFKENVRDYSRFFKHRKVLVVNPENGKAMVVVVGDAGPGRSTGKHLGGSPEVMSYLERQDGRAKGPVIYFFVDDPEDQIPLGPVAIQ